MRTGSQLWGMSVKKWSEASVSGVGSGGAALLMLDAWQRGRHPGGPALGSQLEVLILRTKTAKPKGGDGTGHTQVMESSPRPGDPAVA